MIERLTSVDAMTQRLSKPAYFGFKGIVRFVSAAVFDKTLGCLKMIDELHDSWHCSWKCT